MTLATWAIVALLISLNGLYVAAEFAAVSVRRSRIRGMAEEGDRLARALLPTLEDGANLDRYVAACQIGITVSSLGLGAYGQASLGVALTPLFEGLGRMQTAAAQSTSIAVVLVLLTTLQMILGELVPKSLALQYPATVARFTVLPIRWSERALAWFIVILNGSGWVVLRLLRVEPKPHRHIHSVEDIKYLVAESGSVGHLAPEDQRRLNQALGLTKRTARELMVPRTRIEAIDENGGLRAAIEAAVTTPYTRFPVYRDSLDQIVGIVHSKDLVAAALADDAGSDQTLSTHLQPILAVHESLAANRVLALMREERGIMAVVVDDFGGTAGIVTTEDILREFLGELADEFKHAGGGPERLVDGRVRLPGDVWVRDVGPWLGVQWTGEADTVGGLVMERLGRIPEEGDAIEIDGVEVVVERLEGRAIATLIARPVRRGQGGTTE